MKLENIINKTKKFLGTSLLLGTLSVSLPCANVQACYGNYYEKSSVEQSPLPVDLFLKYESSLVNRIKNIPLKIRDVPEHPDTWYKRDITPIEDAPIKLYDRVSLGAKLGKKILLDNNTRLILGIGLDFNFSIGVYKENNKRKDIKQRDYNLAKLSCPIEPTITATYYYVHPSFIFNWNKLLRPSLYSEIETQITKNMGLGLGYELFTEKLIAENGWDKEGSLETRKRYNLADLIVGQPYVSLRLNKKSEYGNSFYSIDFGLNNIIKKRLTNTGKQTDINFRNTCWFVGFRMGDRVSNLKQK